MEHTISETLNLYQFASSRSLIALRSSAKVRLARYEGIKQNGTEKGKGKKSLRKQISFFKKKKKEIVRRSPQSNHLITKCMQSKFLTRPR